jgi:hypothetical protein
MASGAGAGADTALPASLKRRAGAIGRKALEAALAVIPISTQPRIILASRHGEYGRTLSLLNSLAEDGITSPADFSMAVHHGLAGLLSIATGNKAGHTAVAAGGDSLAYGVLEAALAANEAGEPCVLIYFDADLPPPYPLATHAGDLALALMIHPAAQSHGDAMMMTAKPLTGEAVETGGLAPAFLDFLASRQSETEAAGSRSQWRWRRVG